MEKITLYGGSASKKTYDQCVNLLSDLLNGSKVGVMCLDPEKYKEKFYQITNRKIKLKKLIGENNIYIAELS